MLSTSFAFGLSIFSLLAALIALILAVRAVRLAATQTLAKLEKSRLAAIEAELTELSDSYDALLSSHKKLRSRIGMRKLREQQPGPDVPDWRTDPAAFKRAMRLKHLR